MTDEEPKGDPVGTVREQWAVAKPTKADYAAMVTDLNATKLVGKASVFERGPYIPITHMGYFKRTLDAFLVELKSKDRRSAKEWEYVNGAGVWVETGLAAISLCKETECTMAEFTQRLALAEDSFKAALEVLSMRAQYFRVITEHGIEEARQMAFLVKQGHDDVHSESYRTAREALTGKLEIEAAKQLAKARIERVTKKKGGPAKGNADSD